MPPGVLIPEFTESAILAQSCKSAIPCANRGEAPLLQEQDRRMCRATRSASVENDALHHTQHILRKLSFVHTGDTQGCRGIEHRPRCESRSGTASAWQIQTYRGCTRLSAGHKRSAPAWAGVIVDIAYRCNVSTAASRSSSMAASRRRPLSSLASVGSPHTPAGE